MSTVSIYALANAREPRGAAWAADAVVALRRWMLRLTGRKQTVGAASPVQQAAAVREMARGFLVCDPGFAADLLAAADRHEALHEGR